MNDLETLLCKLAAHEQELGLECKGHMAIVDEESMVGTFCNITLLPKYCEAYEWFGDRQFKCQYASKNMLNCYCLYDQKNDINKQSFIKITPKYN